MRRVGGVVGGGAASWLDSGIAYSVGRVRQRESPSPSVLFVRVASKGLTDAIVVRVANAGLKSVCFHTDWRCLVSVDTSMI
jgi:hypothetical protein